ncbi:unnamed protein product [Litomosoides sigmodontis]|uniref:Uncharacterized protein n=1 Tax=Litomosoides sigmodontis TaxID=42156 RepID=A0A3P6TC01_LITSI|nr:unnamed protein product [Litomosoides sigmodontis]
MLILFRNLDNLVVATPVATKCTRCVPEPPREPTIHPPRGFISSSLLQVKEKREYSKCTGMLPIDVVFHALFSNV